MPLMFRTGLGVFFLSVALDHFLSIGKDGYHLEFD